MTLLRLKRGYRWTGLIAIIVPEDHLPDPMPLVLSGSPRRNVGPENSMAGGSFLGKPLITVALQAHEGLKVACGRLPRIIINFADGIARPGNTAQAGAAAIELPEGNAHDIGTGGHYNLNDF